MTNARIASFAVQPVHRFHGQSQPVRRPKEFTCFSYDDTHTLHLDDRALRWYYPPQEPGADLSRGFETFDKHDDSQDEHLDSLLAAIAAHEQRTQAKIDAQVVTWRGMMTKIMATPYDDRDGFEMNATYYQGCIYIEENFAYRATSRQEQDARQSRAPARTHPDRPWFPPAVMTYWGYKFETLSTLPRPWGEMTRDEIEGRAAATVSNKAQYCSVVRTGIGAHILCLGGEVDAVWDSKPAVPGTPVRWVELKTSQDIQSPRDLAGFERKLLKFWIQSFLLGVPTIVVGFRSRHGHLVRLEEIATETIPGNVKMRAARSHSHSPVPWDGDTCINFAAAFLDWLRATMVAPPDGDAEDNDGVWRIRRQPGSPHIEVFRVEQTGHGRILPDDFLNWRIKLALGADKTAAAEAGAGAGAGAGEAVEASQ